MASRTIALEGITSLVTTRGPLPKFNLHALRSSSMINSEGCGSSLESNVASTAWIISGGDGEKLLGHFGTHRVRGT